jgi:formate/nitrite transporter FocA (FNT family)
VQETNTFAFMENQRESLKFEELQLEPQGNWLRRKIASSHVFKTLLYCVVGALIGYALFYFDQNAESRILWNKIAFGNVLGGLAFGFFITNSPCARGKC